MIEPKVYGEPFQVNGEWHQDYLVDDGNGGTIVKRYYHDGTNWKPLSEKKISLEKISNTESGINLKKNVVNLDKTLIDLTKKSNIDMSAHAARVAVAIDYSGSMKHMYKKGNVQRILSRLVPLGLRFDDNGELDVWLFHTGYRRIESMDMTNFDNYVSEVLMNSGERFGGTSYSPVIQDILNKYTVEEPSNVPSFIIFITDGANDDERKTNETIIQSSKTNTFIQFIGTGGNDSFRYLRKLDDLQGRPYDNTGFIEIKNFDNVSDDELYHAMLEQYIDWLKATKLG